MKEEAEPVLLPRTRAGGDVGDPFIAWLFGKGSRAKCAGLVSILTHDAWICILGHGNLLLCVRACGGLFEPFYIRWKRSVCVSMCVLWICI